MTSAENAITKYVDADGVRFAYRQLGRAEGIPLVLHVSPALNRSFLDLAPASSSSLHALMSRSREC